MIRVLFVDDEQRVLDGLRRMLHRYRRHWEMDFAGGGEEALVRLGEQPYDVLVSDMKMPGMDGATLLERVKEAYPQTVRLILSGHTEQRTALEAVPVAHQFLSKPCEPEYLSLVIDRACGLRSLLADETLRRVAGNLGALPAVPASFAELSRLLADPDVNVQRVAGVIERDPGLAAKILQVVNSAFFGLPRQLSSVAHAVSYLGTNMVRSLVLSIEVCQAFDSEDGSSRLQSHAILTASIAKRMFTERTQAEHAFTAGLLHDIGKLIIAARLPDVHDQVQAGSGDLDGDCAIETRLLGVSHAEIGAYLLGLWGLPYPIVEAVANHHHPRRVATDTAVATVAEPALPFDLLTAVHVADALAHHASGQPAASDAQLDALDRGLLCTQGVEEQLADWLAMSDSLAAGSGGL